MKKEESGFTATVNVGSIGYGPIYQVQIEARDIPELDCISSGKFTIYCDSNWQMFCIQAVFLQVHENFERDTRGLSKFIAKVFRKGEPVTVALRALKRMGAKVCLMRHQVEAERTEELADFDAFLAEELKSVPKRKRLAVAA